MNQDIINEAIRKLAQQASKNARQNNIAASMRFGGKYTPDGMTAAEREAELNAMDRINAKRFFDFSGGP